MTNSTKRSKSATSASGRVMTVVPGFVLVKDRSRRAPTEAPVGGRASELLPKVAEALSTPGISRDVVFKGKTKNAYSYSVDTTDTSRIVRVAPDGTRTIGRLAGDGRFVRVKAV